MAIEQDAAPVRRPPALTVPAYASIGAGMIHAAAIGIHTEHVTLTRIFVALAFLQVAVGVLALVRAGKAAAAGLVVVGAVAVAGWFATRTTGIGWIDGLEEAEEAQFADIAAAVLGGIGALGGVLGLAPAAARARTRLHVPVAIVAGIAAAVTVPAMISATTHRHTEGEHADAAHAHDDSLGATVQGDAAAGDADDSHAHADDEAAHDAAAHDETAHAKVEDAAGHTPAEGADHAHATAPDDGEAVTWPRPWDPADGIDFAGVDGVTADQQARAEQLVADTLRELPRFADTETAIAAGYSSIGDARTGFEHYINRDLIFDDTWLDPTEPESLVYRVDGDARTLVSAMFIASGRPIDDPELVDYGGALMQWHVHDNLCWALDEDGVPKVVAVTDDHGGTCPEGTIHAGGENPMVHVWVTPHACGPFAALEGHGAGQAAVDDAARTDQCGHDHGAGVTDEPATTPYDPAQPIDLGGVEGVTPEQQAFAENLVAATVRDLPMWSDVEVAEAAGFRSIGDGLTGHEHFIKWDAINDDVHLDPRAPESLVYEPQPDGSRRLVAAMFMLPRDVPLAEVPDWGGALMQWHVHDDLCFSDDPVAPQVRGVTTPGGPCAPPLVRFQPAPMIHVWITPHECGPFAALEGIGGGQIEEGAERWCDTAHGAH